MRSIWKGSISFGLVNIPVKMYSASHERELKFHLLHKKDMSEIRYARICKEEEKEVPWSEIVKGYDYANGEFVILEEADFKKAEEGRSKAIEIIEFANESEIDTIYYDKPYFLEPDKSHNAYILLREALHKTGKVGIAKFTVHSRQHICVLKSFENLIVLNQLRYQEEILNPNSLEIGDKEKASSKELEVAVKLINHLTTRFDPQKFKDTYVDDLKEIIEKKAKGKKILPKGIEREKPSKVQDIMSLLKASLEDSAPKKTRKRKAG
jgi:DNA end-binding protein Ku